MNLPPDEDIYVSSASARNKNTIIQKHIQQSSLYSITVMVLVAVISTLITLLFSQTVLSLPIHHNNLFDRLTNEVNKLSHLVGTHNSNSNDNTEFQNHEDLLYHLKNDFYSNNGITHDIFIKSIHSHNDYWRKTPLLDALSLGIQSVEADIWYFPENNDDNIYVGHSKRALKTDRLLESLYLDQLYAILSGSNNLNTTSSINSTLPIHSNPDEQAGVWDTDSYKTLYFFIDFKTDGDELFNVLSERFDRFRSQNWLSWYNTSSEEFHWGPVTVIGTGNTPLNKVLNQGERRDIFIDGPLYNLTNTEDTQKYSLGLSPIASSSLKQLVGNYNTLSGLSDDQIEKAKLQIDEAHNLGIKTRIWDTPWWPVSTKYKVWHQIIQMGSDFLNADDLVDAVAFRN